MMPANLDRDEMAFELIRRSYENWKDYQGKYEITHLLNSLLCLLVLPKETFYTAKNRSVSNDSIGEGLLFRLQNGIGENGKNTQVGLNEIIRHIRNAICHGGIQFAGEHPPCESDPVMVHTIEFEDNYNGSCFKIKISKEDLATFIEEFYRWITKRQE